MLTMQTWLLQISNKFAKARQVLLTLYRDHALAELSRAVRVKLPAKRSRAVKPLHSIGARLQNRSWSSSHHQESCESLMPCNVSGKLQRISIVEPNEACISYCSDFTCDGAF